MVDQEKKLWSPSKEIFTNDIGEYKTYYDSKEVERKLYLSDSKKRLNGEESEEYRNRRQYNKIMLKSRLSGNFIWRSKNYETKKFLKEAFVKGIVKEELNEYLVLSQSCNQGTRVKNKL